MPAASRIAWISSASVTSSASATCTMSLIGRSPLRRVRPPRPELSRRGVERATLDELRRSPLSETGSSMISKSLGHDRLGEDRARLACGVGPEVPLREVREREQLTPAVASELRRVGARSSARSRGALALVLEERRLVDEQIGAGRRLDDRSRRRGVPGDHELPAGPGGPSTSSGCTIAAAGERDRLAAPAGRPLGAGGTPSASAASTSKRPGRVVLDERIADRRDAVVDGERHEAVAVAVERVAGLELHELVRIREPAEDAPQRCEELDEARRPVDRDRHLAPAERERLQHARAARGSGRRGSG